MTTIFLPECHPVEVPQTPPRTPQVPSPVTFRISDLTITFLSVFITMTTIFLPEYHPVEAPKHLPELLRFLPLSHLESQT